MKNYYPIMLNLTDKLCVVIGGGTVAFRKVRDLLEAGAHVRVIAPFIDDEIKDYLHDRGDLEIVDREYYHGDLKGAVLAYCTTNDRDVNFEVYEEAMSRGVQINMADDPGNSSFFVPSTYSKGELLLAISTGGSSPAMAARIRRQLASHLPENIEEQLVVMKRVRELIRFDEFKHLSSEQRGRLLTRIANDDAILEKLLSFEDEDPLFEYLQELAK